MKTIYPAKAAQKIIAITLLSFMLGLTHAAPPDEPQNVVSVNESVNLVSPKSQNGIDYLSGGIGDEELAAIKQAARDYNLHLTFSEGRSNAYTSDIRLTINRVRGKNLLSLEQVGPLVYIKLPAGQYDITADLEGRAQKRRVTVGSKASKNVQFHWNASEETLSR
ncbi:MAG: carboxypeptidase regulatory-like domain-containing protein [Pseudomonadota bacterium]